MTATGGFNGNGTIIKINEDGTSFSDNYSLSDSIGSYPQGNLIKNSNNILYGMTNSGGFYGEGVIFSFNPSTNIYTDLHDFNDTMGANPHGNLILATDGKFYGLTQFGGALGFGVLFSLDPSDNTYSDLHDFNDTLGGLPYGSLIQASNGKFYGMTFLGGATSLNSNQGFGVIFSYNPFDSTYDVLHQFDFNDGAFPRGSLFQASNNKLYGMTAQGGIDSLGELFSFALSDSVYTSLHDFALTTGSNPFSSLIQANDGNLYGMTYSGGLNNMGVIFSIDTLSASYSDKHDFDTINGANPYGSLIMASNNKLYGMTFTGGANNDGIIFRFNTDSTLFDKLFDFYDTTGVNPYGSLIELPANTSVNYTQINAEYLSVYPNPTSNQLTIDCSSIIKKIRLENILGQIVYEETINAPQQIIFLSSLPAGVYFLTVTSQSKTLVNKLIINR